MRIGISALFYASGGSLSNLVQLLRAWQDDGTFDHHQVVLFVSAGTHQGLRREAGPNVLDSVTIRVMMAADRGLAYRLIVEQFGILEELRRERIDVLFCPGNVIPHLATLPTVVTFQNAAPFCDSSTFRNLRAARWLQFRVLGWLMRATARSATRVVFISDYFHRLFVERFAFDPQRGSVILRAAGSHASQKDPVLEETLGIRGPFILSVSNINPYKNLIELIDAFALAVSETSDTTHQLVIVGLVNFPWYLRQMLEAIARHGLEGRVIYTGELHHRGVESLLAGCESFAFSSTCENCPTAMIEAMSAGLPIASSNTGVMPEIGGDAVLYFDPYDRQSIKRALSDLMTNPTLRLDAGRRARERAASFPDAAEVARRTLAVIKSAVTKMVP